MRHIPILILSLLWVLSSQAQEFGTHWISHPLPNDSSEVWFRKSYAMPQRPIQAFLGIASTGNYKLYVNERNVTASNFFDGTVGNLLLHRTIDITSYLKEGENTIAVWYAPQQGKPSHGKQLSADFYGWRADSLPFYHQTDGTWLVRQVENSSNGSNETFDARSYTQEWKANECDTTEWLHPTGSMEPATLLDSREYRVFKAENTIYKVLRPISSYTDSLGFHIDFGRPFHGTIRLTLRDTHKGDTLYINGYQYICNGELDEQAFFRFRYQDLRTYTLTWSNRFKKKYIVNIEGLEMRGCHK